MNTKREKGWKRKQRRIIDAADKLIAIKGMENVAMEDIANAAELTRKTLYAYFKTKDDLLFAVYLKGTRLRINYIKKRIGNVKGAIEKLSAFGDCYYKYYSKYKEHLKLHMNLENSFLEQDDFTLSRVEEYKEMAAEGEKILSDVVELGFKENKIRKDLNIELFLHFWFITSRAILQRCFIYPQLTKLIRTNYISSEEFYYEYLKIYLESIITKE